MNRAGEAPSEFRNGTKPLFAALLGTAFGASPVPYNVVPLVIGPINEEFGWDFTVISGGIAVYGLIGALLAPVYGMLADRRGVRLVALSSLFAFGIFFSAFWALPASLAAYYALWALIGLVAIGSTPVTWSRAVGLWFERRRGTALGIMLLGTSLSGLLVPHIANAAIDAGGWRLAFPAAALLPLLIALPVGLLWFREPRADQRPAALVDVMGRVSGRTLAEAAHDYRFWVLLSSILAVALAYGGAYIHLGQMVILHGFEPESAALVITCMAAGIFFGRLAAGVMFDYLWAPAVAMPMLLMGSIACLLLMGTAPVFLPLLAAGLMLGFASGAETDAIAYLTSRYFGMANYGRIYGVIYMPYAIGASLSPLVYGAVRDGTGSYDAMLLAAAVLFAAGGTALLTLGRYPSTFAHA